jgi:hypothetical protein
MGIFGMRVNLIAQPFRGSKSSNGKVPLSLTIRPACSLPGEYQFPTDSEALMLLLRQKTDLAAPVLERFEGKLCAPVGARPLGVELSEHVLTEIVSQDQRPPRQRRSFLCRVLCTRRYRF